MIHQSAFCQQNENDDLSLDDTTSSQTDSFQLESSKVEASLSESSQADSSGADSELAENVNLASPLEVKQNTSALYGFSVGMMMTYQPFYEKYSTTSSMGVSDVDRQTENIENLGFIIRYAETPFYSLGVDINVSYLKSQNHSSIPVVYTKTLSEITTVKAELNFVYAIKAGKLPLYFMLGGGYQQVLGSEIEKLINVNGFGGQLGLGVVVLERFNLEGLYSYYIHKVSDHLVAENAAGVPAQTVDPGSSTVFNQGFVFRGTYNINY